MSEIQIIPLAQLKPSTLNVRKTGGKKVEELAASIRATGLQQNLGVVPNGKGYGVAFGGRRLRALKQLQKDGELPESLAAGIPCRVMTPEEAQEASLAENTIRVAMHPLDQFGAFQSLVDEGKTEADVAARFGVTELVVRQRLRLARVSPKLLQAYGAGDMRLDQLQAYAIIDDQERQEAHWKTVRHNEYGSSPERIRRDLLQAEVGQSDARVQLVGVQAYLAAGGTVREDLFSDTVVLLDVPLLDKLAAAALEEAAELLRADGWAWAEVVDRRPDWDHPSIEGEDVELTDSESVELDELEEKDELTIDERVRLAMLQEEFFTDEQKAMSGVQLMLGHGGNLAVWPGLLRDGEEAPQSDDGEDDPGSREQDPESGETSADSGARRDEKPAKQPGDLSFSALQRLQAEASAIVQLQVANSPHIATALLVAKLATDLYNPSDVHRNGGYPRTWVHIESNRSRRVSGPFRAAVAASVLGEQVDDIDAEIRQLLPARIHDLPTWAVEQSPGALQKLLALLVARSIDGVDGQEGDQTGIVPLAAAARVDLSKHWTPSEDWLGTLPKAAVVAMVADAAGDKSAAPLAKLKKGEIAAAALLLFPAGWIPKPLRAPRQDPAPTRKKSAKGKAAAAGDVGEG